MTRRNKIMRTLDDLDKWFELTTRHLAQGQAGSVMRTYLERKQRLEEALSIIAPSDPSCRRENV